MTKKSRKTPKAPAPVAPAPTLEEVVAGNDAAAKLLAGEHYVEPATLADVVELDPEVEADNAKPGSVVKPKYKHRYAERAREAGLKSKVAQRSAWDWLAQTLAAQVLDDKKKLVVGRFLKLLDLNGVDHSKWTNRSKGWEGRLRMTGRLALQRVVAESGVLKTEDDEMVAPADWVEKYKN